MRRSRQVLDLFHPLAKAMGWAPVVAGGAAAVAIVYFRTRTGCMNTEGGRRCLELTATIQATRIAALLIGIGTASILEDPAEDAVVHSPTPLWLTRVVRVVIALPVATAAWMICLMIASTASFVPPQFPRYALTLEAISLAAVGLAVSAAASNQVRRGHSSLVAGPMLIGLAMAGFALPGRAALFVPAPTDQHWLTSHWLWGIILCGTVIVIARFSNDYRKTGIVRHHRPSADSTNKSAASTPSAGGPT